jgi:hypothetical protein
MLVDDMPPQERQLAFESAIRPAATFRPRMATAFGRTGSKEDPCEIFFFVWVECASTADCVARRRGRLFQILKSMSSAAPANMGSESCSKTYIWTPSNAHSQAWRDEQYHGAVGDLSPCVRYHPRVSRDMPE